SRDAGRRLVARWETRPPVPSRSTPTPPADPGSPAGSGPQWPGIPDCAPRLSYKHLLVRLPGYTNPRENASGREGFEVASGTTPPWQHRHLAGRGCIRRRPGGASTAHPSDPSPQAIDSAEVLFATGC